MWIYSFLLGMFPVLFVFLIISFFLKRTRPRLLKENKELDMQIEHLKKESQKLDEKENALFWNTRKNSWHFTTIK